MLTPSTYQGARDCKWIGNSLRGEVRIGIEFSFTIVGSEGGLLGKEETPVLASGDMRQRDCFCRLVSNLGRLITAEVGGSLCNLRSILFLDCLKRSFCLEAVECSLCMVNRRTRSTDSEQHQQLGSDDDTAPLGRSHLLTLSTIDTSVLLAEQSLCRSRKQQRPGHYGILNTSPPLQS